MADFVRGQLTDALERGLHVVCEKELALTAAQAWQMTERAEQMGVKNMTFFTFRWLPHTRFIYELIQSGYLGRLYHCHISYVSGMARDGQYKWRFDGERSNGILGDLGSHLIDLARWYCGDFSRVSAQLGQGTAATRRHRAPPRDSVHLACAHSVRHRPNSSDRNRSRVRRRR